MCRYVTLRYVTLRYVTLRYVTLRYVTLRDVTWRDVTWRDVTWRDVTWRDVALRYVALRKVVFQPYMEHGIWPKPFYMSKCFIVLFRFVSEAATSDLNIIKRENKYYIDVHGGGTGKSLNTTGVARKSKESCSSRENGAIQNTLYWWRHDCYTWDVTNMTWWILGLQNASAVVVLRWCQCDVMLMTSYWWRHC